MKKKDIYTRCLAVAEGERVVSMEDIAVAMDMSVERLDALFREGSREREELSKRLQRNRRSRFWRSVDRLEESTNPTAGIALAKLFGTQAEREALSSRPASSKKETRPTPLMELLNGSKGK